MVDRISTRQQQILKLLLENKAGLSIDEIAQFLGISRTAVQQHFTTLERDGFIQMGGLSKTGGRPVRAYVLTEAGINSFPKQYAWFSELILSDLKAELGTEAFQGYLHKLAESLSQSFLPAFSIKSADDRLHELVNVMEGLGFQAKIVTGQETQDQAIEACNCVYHDLAQKHEEICEFDRTLIATLLAKDIEQVECMAKGGAICRFKILNKNSR